MSILDQIEEVRAQIKALEVENDADIERISATNELMRQRQVTISALSAQISMAVECLKLVEESWASFRIDIGDQHAAQCKTFEEETGITYALDEEVQTLNEEVERQAGTG